VVGTVTRTYDADFRLATEAVTGGQTVTFQYDSDSLLTAAGALSISRSAATGFVTGSTLGGISDSRTYDSFGDEQTYSASFGTTPLYSVDYGTRDALGRTVSKTEMVAGEQHAYGYTYDARGRLSDVTKDGAPLSHYDYNANGNRLTGPGLTASPVYDAQDRLLSYGNCTYSYAPEGSLQTKTCPNGVVTYGYDSFGNLRNVTLTGGTAISYVIDGVNRRIGKKINGVLMEGFLYGSQLHPAVWLNGDGSVRARFVYALDVNVPEYMVQGTATYRFITDQVGSVRLVVDASTGAVAERIDYDEFGNVLSDSAPGFQPFGFAGGLLDRDVGLTRCGARDYDPSTGRWTAKDPLRLRGGPNLYVYASADPVNNTDPLGLFLGSAHHKILEGAFPNLSVRDLAILKFGSDMTDRIGGVSTDPFYERMHAMTAPGQSVDDARIAYQKWVIDNLNTAIERERKGCHEAALRALGMGMHAIVDSYSSAHEGFQVWAGPWITGPVHGPGDYFSGFSSQRIGSATLEIQAYYNTFLMRSRAPDFRYRED